MGIQKRKESNFVLQGIILASASIIVRIIGLIYRIPLTNILGNEGNAFYSNAFEVYNIALLLSSYSIPLAVSKLVSVRMEKKEEYNVNRVLKGALILSGTLGLVASLSVYFGAVYIATNIMRMPMSSYALRVLGPCLFIVSILGVIRGYFQGRGTTLPTAISQILEQVLNAVVSVTAASYLFKMGKEILEAKSNELIPAAYGAAGGTMGTVAGAGLALIFMCIVLLIHKKDSNKVQIEEVNKESYIDIFKVLIITIIPVVLSSAISNINTILDQGIYNNIMASQGYSEGEYANLWGIFSGKYKVLINVPLGVSSALAAAFIPSITAAIYRKDTNAIEDRISLAMKTSMLIAIPSFVAFFFFGNDILFLLFNDDSVTASNIIRIGCFGLSFICLSAIACAVLQGFDRMMIPVTNALKAIVVHMISLLLMLLIFRWNIYSVVLADVIFGMTLCFLNVRKMCTIAKYKIKWREVFLLPFYASLFMILCSSVIYYVLNLMLYRKIAFILTIMCAIVIYVIGLFRFKIISKKDLLAIPLGNKIYKILFRIKIITE